MNNLLTEEVGVSKNLGHETVMMVSKIYLEFLSLVFPYGYNKSSSCYLESESILKSTFKSLELV